MRGGDEQRPKEEAMALKITGSVKNDDGVGFSTDVRLRIFKDQDAKRVGDSELDVDLRTQENGTFYHQISDTTGVSHDYNKMILWGEVRNNADFEPKDVIILGREVELHFQEPVSWWTRLRRWIGRAALLDALAYGEMSMHPLALGQALIVAAVASLVFGLGLRANVPGMFVVGLGTLLVWGVLTASMYVLGTKVLAVGETQANVRRFLAPVGFATTPLLFGGLLLTLLRALGGTPGVRFIVLVVVLLWTLVALAVAAHQALSFRKQWGRVAVVVFVPIIVMAAIAWATTR
jgi:hypothetical protein